MKTRNKIICALCAVFCACMIFGGWAAASASPLYVEVSVEEAIPGAVRYEREMVFHVQLQASRPGQVWLVTKGFLGNTELSCYEKSVDIEAGQQIIKQNLFLDSGLTSVLFQILDEEGNLLDETEYLIEEEVRNSREAFLYAGIISDVPEQMELFQGLTVNGVYEAKVKTIPLSLERLPEQAEELKMLDAIFVEQYNTLGLSKEQRSAILEWVKDGGRLIVGTGAYGRETTAFLKSFLTEENVLIQSWTGFGYLSEADFTYLEIGRETKLYVTKLQEGVVLKEELGTPMLQMQNYGAGRMILCSFSLAEFGGFLEQYQNEYQLGLPTLEEWLSEILDKDYIDQQVVLGGYSADRYWDIYNTVTGTATDKIPKIGNYAVLLFVYLLLVGPLSFLILKKVRKQALLQGVMVAIALVFSFLVFFMGRDTRYDKPFIVYSRIVENDDGQEEQTTILNVRAPFIQQYQLVMEGSSQVEIIHEGRIFSDAEASEGDQVKIRQDEEKTEISFLDIAAFSPRLFLAECKEQKEAGLSCQVGYYEGAFSGTVTNQSDTGMENMAVLFGSHYVLLGKLDPGETVELSGFKVYDTLWETEYASAHIAGQALGNHQPGVEEKNRNALLNYYIDRWRDREEEQAVVIGFRKEETSGVLSGTDFDLSGNTLYAQRIVCDQEKDGVLFRDRVYHTAWTEEGHTSDDNRVSYSETTIINYDLGNHISKIGFVSREVGKTEGNFENFQGQIYLYNYSKGRYDQTDINTLWDRRQLKDYLTENNTLRVRYVQDQYSGWEYGIVLPYLWIKGGE